jgi:hypothetical protein
MKIGSLIRIHHHPRQEINGQIGILMNIVSFAGSRDAYIVNLSQLGYSKLVLYIEQCEVINENR